MLDALDDTVTGYRVDDDIRADRFDRLMMRAVDGQRLSAGDAVQQRTRPDPDIVARLVARVRLAMRQRVGNLIRDVLDQRAAEYDVEELLAAADAEHRQVPGESTAGDREFEG